MGKTEDNLMAEEEITSEQDDSMITLSVPVERGGGSIASVRITDAVRQPGSLRGLKLYDVMQSDVDSLIKLIPRVTEPALMEHEILTMDNRDFVALATGIVSFLVPS
ncbi:phage tail assembly protein [Enterobacter sp. CGMCC 5087]|uniref:phage tail assembly protein n=1 Tax=Enterobacter sp. CGMCC 5087 TaxID=2183878 RepID=UPI00215A103A|nr:phage tail assembly protein [Enterobacter sp. CGMCC 5087]